MEVLHEKPVKVSRTATTSEEEARAYDEKGRRLIVKALYRRTMTLSEIGKMLDGDGYKKSYTTLLNHVNALKKAGVVDVAKINTVRGTVEKHYTATVRLLDYSMPEDFEATYASEIGAAERRIGMLLGRLAPRVANRNSQGADDSDYEQFVLAEIVNRAMTRAFESRSGAGGGAPRGRQGPDAQRRRRRGARVNNISRLVGKY